MRGVEDLVALARDRSKQPVEVALRLGWEEELGLLHQDDQAGDPRLPPRLQPRHEAVRRRGRSSPRGAAGIRAVNRRSDEIQSPGAGSLLDREARRSSRRADPPGRTGLGTGRSLRRGWAPGGVPVTEIVDPSASSPTIRMDVVDGRSSSGTSFASNGAAVGSRSAQIAVSRFDLPALCSPTIAAIVPGRKLVSFRDRNPRTCTPVSPKGGTGGCYRPGWRRLMMPHACGSRTMDTGRRRA